MKAISLWQPWATLWLLSDPDEKVFETRGWYTPWRGPLLVHAAKKRDGEVRAALLDPFFCDRLAAHGLRPEDLVFGALIGQVRLVDCQRMDRIAEPGERERRLGLWEPDRFAWRRAADPEIWRRPAPYRGSQGFFDVRESLEELKLRVLGLA